MDHLSNSVKYFSSPNRSFNESTRTGGKIVLTQGLIPKVDSSSCHLLIDSLKSHANLKNGLSIID